MIEKYGLFDSLEGDEREYAEVDFARLGRALGLDGVRGGENALSVSAAPAGLGVTVAPGLALIQGRYYELEDDGSGTFTLNLSEAGNNPRIDRIVLTLDFTARTVKLGVLKGAEAASPAAPGLTRNTSMYMLSLAKVRVAVGAGALDASVLSGKIMINIDSDDEGIFTVGCAGGARNDITLPVNTAGGCGKQYKLTVSGLLGGHSGVEIDRGRANAIKLLAKVLGSISDVRLADICGGNADNAIPRECTAYFTSDSDVASVVRAADAEYKKEYRDTDGGVTLTLEAVSFDKPLLDKASSETALAIINETESGVIAMSREIVGLPESSENIGIVRLEGGVFHMTVSVRSAKADAKAALIENLRAIAKRNGAAISTRGEYPAWEYKAESHIREIACRVFYEMYGKEAKVITIHAGLECGIFSDKIEGLDCISLGPDNYDIHTTEEHLSISSTARVWDYLINVLKKI